MSRLVVRRGKNETRLYVNGYLVARGRSVRRTWIIRKSISFSDAFPAGPSFHGELDEVRIYRRPLDEAEIQGLVQPGKQFAQPPPKA